jgi:hypothetical protein
MASQTQPTVCIIKTTNTYGEKHNGIDSNDWTETFLNYCNLKENLEEYTQFIKLNTIYDLYMLIYSTIDSEDIKIEDLYYTDDYVYQAIFKTVVKNIDYSNKKLIDDSNKLATQMLGERNIVDGNMIIIKRSIINKDFNYSDINMNDIVDILRNQLIHSAVIIKDNDIVEQNYIYNPLDINFGQSHIDNVLYYEFKFLECRLFFHIDTKAEQNKLNKIASGIYGNNIYGNVLISLTDNSDSSPSPLNITQDIINKIYSIVMYHRKNNSEIDLKKYGRNIEIKNKDIEDYDPNKHTKFEHNGFPEISLCPNFYQVVKLEYEYIKDKFIDYDITFENTLNNIPKNN